MISLKKYLDSVHDVSSPSPEPDEEDLLSAAMAAWGSALVEMGNCSLVACPGVGNALQQRLGELKSGLSAGMPLVALRSVDAGVSEQLRNWGQSAARHYQQKTGEVKEMLIVMARTAESVGARDQRCAGQIHEVTTRLKEIATLDDLTQIRVSIEKTAVELKSSIDRMTAEGKVAIEQLREQVSSYRAKLEEAEKIAFRDALTGLSSRLYMENLMESRITAAVPFSVAIADIDAFKNVNDRHGHMIGDELLKQFAAELTSACRSTDVIGRWGGDEFIILFDCAMAQAVAQKDRLQKWVCGNYTIKSNSGVIKLRVDASFGLAEHLPGESVKELLARADSAMYEQKGDSRTDSSRTSR